MSDALSDCLVIFDLDGTLIDTADDLAAAMNHALVAASQSEVAPDKVRGLVGHGARAMLREGFALNGCKDVPDVEMDAHLALFLDYYTSNIAVHSRAFAGVDAVLEMLIACGAKPAICTNKREAPARQLISELNLDDIFDVIVGGDTMGAPKPDPAPVRRCFELAGLSRGIFIGDSDTDVKAAKSCDLPCLLHVGGYGPFELAGSAFGSFDSYKDAPQLFAAAAAQI